MTDKPQTHQTQTGKAPEIVKKDGPLRAAAWREEGEYGSFYNTKITRYYTDTEGEVRETSTLRERDLLPAAELTREIAREIKNRKVEQQRFQNERASAQPQRSKPRDRMAR